MLNLLTVSVCAQTDSVSIGVDIPKDSTSVDVVLKKKSWFRKAYDFADRVLSPQRDSNYIDVQNYNWCAELQLTRRFELYSIESDNDFSMRVSPDFSFRIGPFFGWRWAFLGYNIDLKSVITDDGDIDLGGSVYSAAFGLDLFYRRVGGSYNIKRLKYKDVDYTDLLKGRPFDGIDMGMTRVSFYYVTNYKKYSHQAAFNQTNRQLRSAGSPIVGVSYAHNRVSVDWDKMSELLNSVGATPNSSEPVGTRIKNDELSFTGGYAYNYVFAKDWVAAVEGTASVGFLLQRYKGEDYNTSGMAPLRVIDSYRRQYVAFNGNARLAVLYNNGPWFAGTQVVMFYYVHGNSQTQTRNLLGCAYLYCGVNF